MPLLRRVGQPTESDIESIVGSASASASGVVELATPAEVAAGTDTGRAVTPEGVAKHVGAAAVLVRDDGTSVAYPASADTDAARGTAIEAARTAATSGEIIYVNSSGTYLTTTSLAKDGVNWYFGPGVTISNATTSVFEVATGMSFTISGAGEFFCTAAATPAVHINHASADVKIDCASIRSDGGGSSPALKMNAGLLRLRASRIIESVGYDAIWHNGGILHVECPMLTGGGASGNALELVNGEIYGRFGRLSATAVTINGPEGNIAGSIWCDYVSGASGNYAVDIATVEAINLHLRLGRVSKAIYVIHGGTIHLHDTIVDSTAVEVPTLTVGDVGGRTILSGVRLLAKSTQFCIAGLPTEADIVDISGCTMNLPPTDQTAVPKIAANDRTLSVRTQVDATDTTLAEVTALQHYVEAGGIYEFHAKLYTVSTTNGGVKAAIAAAATGGCTATSVIYEAVIHQAGAIVNPGTSKATALGTTVANVTAVTAAFVEIRGTITVNAAGFLVPTFAQNADQDTSSILVNSTFNVRRIG